MADQMRNLDWLARNAEFYGIAEPATVLDVLARIEAIWGSDPSCRLSREGPSVAEQNNNALDLDCPEGIGSGHAAVKALPSRPQRAGSTG